MRVTGIITSVRSGEVQSGGVNDGATWQLMTVEGLALFVPQELQNGWERGQRVRLEISHSGDKKIVNESGKTISYQPRFELLSVERVIVPD